MNPSGEAGAQQRILDILLGLWFVIAGAAFFAPYLGVALPDMSAAYGAFLLLSVAALALRLLRGGANGGPEAGAAVQTAPASPDTAASGRKAPPLPTHARERKKRRG